MLNVDSIENGLVIDHIQAGKAMELYHYLNIDTVDCPVAIIRNVRSGKLGKKDMIKIEGRFDLDVALLGYIDPNITVCTIKDYQIHSKTKMKLPDLISGIIRCRNPRCITSQETVTEHQFRLTDKEKRVYRCVYCETD